MRKMFSNWGAALLTMVLLFAGTATLEAQQSSPLKISYTNLSLQRDTARVKRQGQAPTVALPGDTVRYDLSFTNAQAVAIRNVVFNNPLPKGMFLLGGTVTTSAAARVEYSIDGGTTYQAQPMVTVEENGRRVQRPATPESYTHIRWTITDELVPGATVTARYSTRVGGK